MKTGVLGGSFNPPHNGHLAMARAACEERGLDRVWLLVAARPPHKSSGQLGELEHRLEMAKLAAASLPFLEVNDLETRLPGISYTYRTFEVLAEDYPQDELFFIIGADTVPELATWKNPNLILEIADPVVIPRTGFCPEDAEKLGPALSAKNIQKLKKNWLAVEPVDVSSTMIREKLEKGENIDGLVAGPVAEYIHRHGLYRRA